MPTCNNPRAARLKQRHLPGSLFGVLAALFLAITTSGCVVIPLGDLVTGSDFSEQVIEKGDGFFSGKIALIELNGVLSSTAGGLFFASPDNSVSALKAKLDLAADDRGVQGVLLRISSPGGEVTACDNLYHEVQQFRAETGKPVKVR